MAMLVKNETPIYRNCISCGNLNFLKNDSNFEIAKCKKTNSIVIDKDYSKYNLASSCDCQNWKFDTKLFNAIEEFYEEHSVKKENELAC